MIKGIDPMFGSTESTYNHWAKSSALLTHPARVPENSASREIIFFEGNAADSVRVSVSAEACFAPTRLSPARAPKKAP
jgi:hypothetical protein